MLHNVAQRTGLETLGTLRSLGSGVLGTSEAVFHFCKQLYRLENILWVGPPQYALARKNEGDVDGCSAAERPSVMVLPHLTKIGKCSCLMVYTAEHAKWNLLPSEIIFNPGTFRPGA